MASSQRSRWGMRMAPTMVGTPRRTSGKPNVARSDAMTKSQNDTAVTA